MILQETERRRKGLLTKPRLTGALEVQPRCAARCHGRVLLADIPNKPRNANFFARRSRGSPRLGALAADVVSSHRTSLARKSQGNIRSSPKESNTSARAVEIFRGLKPKAVPLLTSLEQSVY